MTRKNYSVIFGSPDGSHRANPEPVTERTGGCKGQRRHAWGPWRQPPGTRTARKRYCKVCGKVQWRTGAPEDGSQR